MRISTLLAEAARYFIGNLRQLAVLFLPILLVLTATEHVLQTAADGRFTVWALVSYVLIYPIYTGALLLLLNRHTRLARPSHRSVWRAALPLWRPLLLLTLISGLILAIIPGVWVAVRLAFAEIYLVVEGLPPLAAMRKSHDTTSEYFWLILLSVASIYAPLIGLSLLFQWWADSHGVGPVMQIFGDTVIAFLGLLANIVIFRIYLLRGVKGVPKVK